MHTIIWFAHEEEVIALLSDGRVVSTRLPRSSLEASGGRVTEDLPVVRELGRVEPALRDQVAALSCDGCATWGLRRRDPPELHLKSLMSILGSQRVLLRDAPRWKNSVDGHYCMNCSIPPR